MFSFLLIVAVFSHTDAACKEGDQILKAMKLDGSPACRHCHCWETVEWVCVVERSACKYTNDDQQLLAMQAKPDQKGYYVEINNKDNILLQSTKLNNFLEETYWKGKANWFLASQHCINRKMRLASISSEKENELLFKIIESYGMYDKFWTSGTDKGHKGRFIWMSTGKPFQYTRWFRNEPHNLIDTKNNESTDCVAVQGRRERVSWSLRYCSTSYFFICEYDIK